MPDNRAPTEGTLFSLDARLLYQAGLKYSALRYSNHKLAQRCDELVRRVAELETENRLLAGVVDTHFGRRLEAEAEVERLRRELADAQETVDTLAGRNFALEALHGLAEERDGGIEG